MKTSSKDEWSSWTSTWSVVRDERVSELRPEVAQGTKEVQAEAEAHSQRGTISLCAVKS